MTKYTLFYNRNGVPEGKPWSIWEGEHLGKIEHRASSVVMQAPSITEEHPEFTRPEKYFVTCWGRLRFEGTKAIIDKG